MPMGRPSGFATARRQPHAGVSAAAPSWAAWMRSRLRDCAVMYFPPRTDSVLDLWFLRARARDCGIFLVGERQQEERQYDRRTDAGEHPNRLPVVRYRAVRADERIGIDDAA